jgi:Zn-dependent M28 family amino/carboxypeptidase
MDSASLHGRTRDVSSDGDESALTIQADLIALARAQGRYFSPDPRLQDGEYFRGDQFAFAKRGIPAFSFRPGQDMVRGGKAAGEAIADAYQRDRYHQPDDAYDPAWIFDGTKQDLALLYRLGSRLAASGQWPDWERGSDFKPVRDRTRSSR